MSASHTPRRRSERSERRAARSHRPGRKHLVAAAAVVLVAGVAVSVALVSRGGGQSPQASCPTGSHPLQVAAAPEIAPVIAAAVNRRSTDEDAAAGGCPPATVASVEPADTAAALRAGGATPDVWVPDSSIWATQLGAAKVGFPDGEHASLARSPFVLAVPSQLAGAVNPSGGTLTVAHLVPAAGQAAPAQWVLADPQQAAGTVASIIALQTSVAGRPDAAAALTEVIRASKRDLGTTSGPAALAQAAATGLAVPTTEQKVAAHNRLFPGAALVAAYPTPAVPADYPFVVLTSEETRRGQATELLTVLRSAQSRAELEAAGFRNADGSTGSTVPASAGVDPGQPASGSVPDAAAVSVASRTLTSITRGSKLLAVVDVSGSMRTAVPGARGANRLDLALQAAVNGLALYPDDTVAGLWTFSTNLTPTTDHRQVVPLVGLGRGPDGTSGRQRLAQGLASVGVTGGWTGLYDTVLAAVREVRKEWDPQRVNSVVLITDGANEDPQGGIDLPTLLQTLRAENDPARPVQVFAIAYGPEGDLAALQQVTQATGGQAYAARDPRTIGSVMLDAIGRRACAPSC